MPKSLKIADWNARMYLRAIALLILVSGGLAPVSGWAVKLANTHNPHVSDARLYSNGYQSLDIAFRGPYRPLADNGATCTLECDSFSTNTGPDNGDPPGSRVSSYDQDLSLDLGQSGPLSFRFSGRRLKMQVEF